MSRIERILERLKIETGSITFQDLTHLLSNLGYVQKKGGKTSGSRVAFYNEELNHIIRLHKPHPGNELKTYQKKYIKSELTDKKLL